MNREDRRETIFQDDGDRQGFVATLGETCTRSGWQVHKTGQFLLLVILVTPNAGSRLSNRRRKAKGEIAYIERPACPP